jgi:hypothetical protein
VKAKAEAQQNTASGLTLRSLILGLIQVLVVCLGAPYAIWVLGSSEITWSFFPIAVGFSFCCLILLNILLKTANPKWALHPAEMITVVVMGLVTTGIPIFMMGFVMSIPTTPYYVASAENQWGTYVLPHLPTWLLPSNDGLAMTWFFEGLPIGEPTPWMTLLHAWAMPMFWWLSFIWTLYFVCFCMVVILRKQWVERERLAYPLMEIPLTLVADSDDPSSRVPAILRNKVFWIGAAIPLFIVFWNIIGFFFHFFPKIEWQHPIQIAHGFPTINIRFYFPVIGFMYFANLNVTFSIWFFYVLLILEEGLFNRFGLGVTEADNFVWGLPSTSWQCWGAFVVLVLWGLWMARDHIRDVFRKAWNPDLPIDDSRELMSYRAAVVGLIVGIVYMLTWLNKAGMEPSIAVFFLGGVLIAYLGITRLVVQAGVFYLTTPIVSQAMTMMTFGTSAISASGLAALGLCYSFFGDVQSIFMPSAAHAARLHDTMRMSRRGLCMAIALALLVGFAVTIIYVISMAYDQGASNFNSWFFRVSSGAGVRSFDDVMAKIKTPADFHTQKLGFFSIGAVAMTFLTFMQYRFPWWPLHPVGLAISAIWMVRNQAPAIFVAWAAKSLIMRFGGIELYRKASPFFIGLILGHFFGIGISFIIDMIFFPGNGHPVLHG